MLLLSPSSDEYANKQFSKQQRCCSSACYDEMMISHGKRRHVKRRAVCFGLKRESEFTVYGELKEAESFN